MKNILLIILSFIGIMQLNAQGVSISNSTNATPDNSAILDLQSTDQGILIPRMTIAQRNSILSPVIGLMIYQTDNTTGFYYYDGIAWIYVTGAKKINDLTDGKYYNNSVYLGDQAGSSATTGSNNNIGVGKDALKNLSSGKDNVALTIGDAGITTGDSNIVVGYNGTNVADGGARNQMNIGNTIYATGMSKDAVHVGIGNENNAPTSTLDIGGSISKPIVVKNGDYTATDADHTIIFHYPPFTGEVVLTLPEASTCKGRIYYIRTIETTRSADRLVIAAHSGDLIDGVSTIEIGFQGLDLDHGQIVDGVTIQSDGTMWWMISASIQPENP